MKKITILLSLIVSTFIFADGKGIAVLDFEGDVGPEIASEITTGLSEKKRYQLVERSQLKKAVEEIQRTQSGITEHEIEIGKLVGGDYLVVGDAKKGEKDIIDANIRIMKTETGVIIGATKFSGKKDAVADALTEFTDRILSVYLLMQNPDSPYSILLKTDKGKNPVYKIGDTIQLKFKILRHKDEAPDTVYVQIYSINEKGTMTLMYPNRFSKDKPLKINTEYSLPADTDDFEWELRPPGGTESVQAIVTTKPLDFFNIKSRAMKEDFPELKQKDSRMTFQAVHTQLKKQKQGDYCAERMTYKLE